MKKKEVLKLVPGTWLEILWFDAQPTAALLLSKPDKCKGDMALELYHPSAGMVHNHAVHTQVSAVLGYTTAPACASAGDTRYTEFKKSKKSKK